MMIADKFLLGTCLGQRDFTQPYQVTPSINYAVLIFNKVQMNVDKEKAFTVIANNNSKENVYIQSATLNGKPYNSSQIHHDAIIEGGK